MTTTYRLNLIEDSHGDVVDIEYWHDACASSALVQGEDAPTLGWPCPEWPDYDVYCEGCKEIVHAAEPVDADELPEDNYEILGVASDGGSLVQLVGARGEKKFLIAADHRMAQLIVEAMCDGEEPIAYAESWAVSRLPDDFSDFAHPEDMNR